MWVGSPTVGRVTENPTLDLYTQRAAGVQDALDAIGPDAWDAPSACDGWTGRDVVAHLVDSQRDFLGSHGASLGARPDLAAPADAWREHADEVRGVLEQPGFADQEHESLGSTTTVGATLGSFHAFDMLVHRWDATVADGRAYQFDDEALDSIEAFTARMGDMIHSPGVCGPALEVGPDADRQERALAAIGRSSEIG